MARHDKAMSWYRSRSRYGNARKGKKGKERQGKARHDKAKKR
jgi:hypothetical protein